jgi:hypothetical protein
MSHLSVTVMAVGQAVIQRECVKRQEHKCDIATGQWALVVGIMGQISSFIKHAFSFVSLGDACHLARVCDAVYKSCLGAESSRRSSIKSMTNCVVWVLLSSIDDST